jgi:hypothetical protein
MFKRVRRAAGLAALTTAALLAFALPIALAEGEENEPTLEQRVDKLEAQAAKDRVHFTGDYRFEAHSIQADIPDHFDGIALQKLLVDTLFFFNYAGPSKAPEGTGFPTP